MAKNSRGFLSGNTKKLRRKKKATINDHVKSFDIGERVIIAIKAERAGAPNLRYQGRMGTISKKVGKKGYMVTIKDGKKLKDLVATAFHLSRAKTPAKN